MRVLTPSEVKTFEQLLQLSQENLLKVMRQFLKKKYKQVISTDDYIVAIGDMPVGLVAHLDTVFGSPPKAQNIYYDRVKNVMWSSDGLGADDRAGVYSIIRILNSGLRPTVILTTEEESGGKGAFQLIKDMPEPPTELKYLIQLDRRGSTDCVFYDCDNEAFNDYVENFGFVMNYGTFSDISTICPAWKIAGVNLSIGYYNEHSFSEILHIGQMINTINRVKDMLEDSDTAPAFEYIESVYSYNWYKTWLHPQESDEDLLADWDPSWGISKEDWKRYMSPQIKCDKCGEFDLAYNIIPVKVKNQGTAHYCPDCLAKYSNIYWCGECGEAFVSDSTVYNKVVYCDDCRGKHDHNDNSKSK